MLVQPCPGRNQPRTSRLPSDQIRQLITAMSPVSAERQVQQTTNASVNMPPPPLPMHALVARNGSEARPNTYTSTTGFGNRLASAPPALSGHQSNGRRYESRSSELTDISMHAGCTSFPSCTTEDEHGLLHHDNPTTPSTAVKGRKESTLPDQQQASKLDYIHISSDDEHSETDDDSVEPEFYVDDNGAVVRGAFDKFIADEIIAFREGRRPGIADRLLELTQQHRPALQLPVVQSGEPGSDELRHEEANESGAPLTNDQRWLPAKDNSNGEATEKGEPKLKRRRTQ